MITNTWFELGKPASAGEAVVGVIGGAEATVTFAFANELVSATLVAVTVCDPAAAGAI